MIVGDLVVTIAELMMGSYKKRKNNMTYPNIHCCDCLDYMKTVSDNTFDLIIADPPYFKIHGDFDFIWKSFDV
jgi:DNA modification methylase